MKYQNFLNKVGVSSKLDNDDFLTRMNKTRQNSKKLTEGFYKPKQNFTIDHIATTPPKSDKKLQNRTLNTNKLSFD